MANRQPTLFPFFGLRLVLFCGGLFTITNAFSISSVHDRKTWLAASKSKEQDDGEESMYDLIVGNDFENEKGALLEMGGDPSFLDPPAVLEDPNSTSEQEAREEEIASILEMGGDPSFLLDSPPAKQESEEAMALEAAGGDPSFLAPPSPKTDDTKSEDDLDKNDWFSMGRQMAKDLLEEQEKEENDDKNGDSEKAAKDEEPQSSSLNAASLLNLATMGRDPDTLKNGPPEDYDDKKEEDKEPQPSPSLLSAAGLFGALGQDFDGPPEEEGEPTLEELEAMGGDPSFLADAPTVDELEAMGGDPFFMSDPPERDAGTKKIASFLDQLPKESTPSPTNKDDSLSPLEQAQKASLEAAQSLVQTSDSLLLAKQEALSTVQSDIQKLQEQLQQLQQQEATLQKEVQEAKKGKEESIQKEKAIHSAFADLGAPPPPEDSSKEEEAFDHLKNEVEKLDATGGDPSFLLNMLQRSEDAAEESPKPMFDENQELMRAELEEMGGDPSFLGPTADELEEMGGDTSFLGGVPAEMDLPASKTTTSKQGLRKCPLTNELLEEETLTQEEQMLEAGGDPAFLGSYDETADPKAYDQELLREEIEEMGGDPSFL